MKILLNTNLVPMFSGTYETQWEVIEYDEEGSEEVEVEYNHNDLMKSIAEAYQQKEDYILSELHCSFLKSMHFTGDTYSPSEYNFKTDQLDFEVDINKAELLKVVESLENNQEFKNFLKENYTSYDGFMSFTPNNYRDFKEAIVKHNDEHDQAIGSLITFLGKPNLIQHGGVSIEEMVYEDWQGNGYNGLDYTIVSPES